MISAARVAEPVQEQIMLLRLQGMLLGWRATLVGWLGIFGGGSVFGWFRRSGSTNLFEEAIAIAALPLAQWTIKRAIRNKEKQLPSFGPSGEVIYGEGANDRDHSAFPLE